MKTARAGRMTSAVAAAVAALMLLAVFFPSVGYAATDPMSTCTIKVDGVTIKTDADPIVENGTTLVPIGVVVPWCETAVAMLPSELLGSLSLLSVVMRACAPTMTV